MKVGDVVRLKSGGPEMTFESFEDASKVYITCVWFFGTDVYRASFHKDTLKVVEIKF